MCHPDLAHSRLLLPTLSSSARNRVVILPTSPSCSCRHHPDLAHRSFRSRHQSHRSPHHLTLSVVVHDSRTLVIICPISPSPITSLLDWTKQDTATGYHISKYKLDSTVTKIWIIIICMRMIKSLCEREQKLLLSLLHAAQQRGLRRIDTIMS
jgi:hypothetical protein